MFKRFRAWLAARRERKAREAAERSARLFALNYIQKHGYDQNRDLGMLRDIAARISEKYLSEVKAVYEELHRGSFVRGESDFDEDNVKMITNIVSMLSREYMALLMIYFGSIENLTSYIGLLLFSVEENIVKYNKMKLRSVRGKVTQEEQQ